MDKSCKRTYVTLSVYHDDMTPNEITQILQLEPTRFVHKDLGKIKKNGWFLSTKDVLSSTVLQDHLIFLYKALLVSMPKLNEFISSGGEARIYCFWESSSGNGGPVLTSEVLNEMSKFCIDVHFDIWCD